MTPIQFKPERHKVHETEFTRFLQREFKDPNLFTYRHSHTGNWMVSVWLKKDRRLLELVNLGPSPIGTSEHVMELRSMVKGTPEHVAARKAMMETLYHMDHNWANQMQDDAREDIDKLKWFRSQLRPSLQDYPELKTVIEANS